MNCSRTTCAGFLKAYEGSANLDGPTKMTGYALQSVRTQELGNQRSQRTIPVAFKVDCFDHRMPQKATRERQNPSVFTTRIQKSWILYFLVPYPRNLYHTSIPWSKKAIVSHGSVIVTSATNWRENRDTHRPSPLGSY